MTAPETDTNRVVKVSLRKIRLNKGGYEVGTGIYFGNYEPFGAPYLFEVEGVPYFGDNGLRAIHRREAKVIVATRLLKQGLVAKFYN